MSVRFTERRLREMAEAKIPVREIAAKLGCASSTVSRILCKLPHVGRTGEMEAPRVGHSLALKLREERKAQKISQTVLAHKSGYSRAQIANWESGRAPMSDHALANVGEALGLELVWRRRGAQ